MWTNIITTVMLHVAIASPDHDGVTNQLLISGPTANASRYAISFSTDEPLPFKQNEWFKATVAMECSKVNPHNNLKSYICNADKITIGNITYKLSEKRDTHVRESDQHIKGSK